MKTVFGFDLAPSNIDLAGAEVELRQALAQESVLKRRLEPVLDLYDYIIIDTPPSLGVLTVNALTASRYVLIPVATEYMALRGLKMLLDTIDSVRSVTNPTLADPGDPGHQVRRPHAQQPRGVRLPLALLGDRRDQAVQLDDPPVGPVPGGTGHATPIVQLHPELDGSKAYKQVAEEILHG